MKRNKIAIIIFTLILVINIFLSYSIYNNSIYTLMEKNANDRLNEVASFGYYLFDNKLDEQIKRVEIAADMFGISDSLTREKSLELLQSAAIQNKLLRSALTTPDGNFITSDNLTGNVSEEEFFKTAMTGKFHITDPTPAVVDKTKKVLLLTSPVLKDEKVIGTLTFSYLCDELEAIFNLTLLNGNGHTLITDQNGNILIGKIDSDKHYSNIFPYMNELKESNLYTSFTGTEGSIDIHAKNDDNSILAKYNQLSQKDWYAITIVDRKYTMDTIRTMDKLKGESYIYIASSVAIYSLIVGFIIIRGIRNYDKLTGLISFNSFKKKASRRLKKNNNQNYIIIKLDIRNFKLINRVYGFEVGNEVIKNMGIALKKTLQPYNCLCARISIDNFILMLPYHNEEEINTLRQAFIDNFRTYMGTDFIDNVDFPTGQYIAFVDEHENLNIEEIYEKVNFAHQAAKQSDLNLIIDYDETIEKEAIDRKDMENRMYTALANNDFKLYLQPKFCLKQDKICSAEALVRWCDENGNILPPGKFLPLFEKNGFIVSIDKYLFEEVAKLLRKNIDAGKAVYPISVNFSRLHLSNDNLVNELCAIVDKYNLPHHLFEIELTESIVFDNIKVIIELIDELHQNGFTLSIDDFGSGYSSLALLKDINVDVVKLDGSFFSMQEREQRSDIIINNILRMTKELHIKTVAEGIETKDYVDFLKTCDCDMIQGYYYSRPIPKEEFEEKYF